jgi:hypothetical protein
VISALSYKTSTMSDFIQQKLWNLVSSFASDAEAAWLTEKASADALQLMTAFVAAPRFVSKKIVVNAGIGGLNTEGWSLVRLSRVWLITFLDASDKENYVKNIETLFDTAEMNELVALYSALSLLHFPEQWLPRATDAVRSNMGFVFDSIALHNSYPERYFSEAAWNQLVLKTIFNDKPIHLIEGLDKRANAELANTLSDFAHERWAAGRKVPAQVWRLVSHFLTEALLKDLQHLLSSNDEADRKAAALVTVESGEEAALKLLSEYPEVHQLVTEGKITWSDLE